MFVLMKLLLLVAAIIFWILWLTVMKHPADPQNASVPFVAMIAAWTLFDYYVVGKHGQTGP
jgi:hypothetical protein